MTVYNNQIYAASLYSNLSFSFVNPYLLENPFYSVLHSLMPWISPRRFQQFAAVTLTTRLNEINSLPKRHDNWRWRDQQLATATWQHHHNMSPERFPNNFPGGVTQFTGLPMEVRFPGNTQCEYAASDVSNAVVRLSPNTWLQQLRLLARFVRIGIPTTAAKSGTVCPRKV